MNTPTVSLFLDKRRILKTGKYPIKISIIFNRKSKLYSTNICLDEIDWEKTFNSKRANDFQTTKLELEAFKGKAIQIIQVLGGNFSFERFDEIWFGKNKRSLDKSNVFIFFEDHIKKLREEGRGNTAIADNNTLSALRVFRTSLTFNEINVQFLKNFERFMLKRGNSITTVGIYMRSLRVIVNLAIAENVFKQEDYPFGKSSRGYVIPKGERTEAFLTKDQILLLRDYQTESQEEEKARDFFLFSYLCNGMNFKDVCSLKFSNIIEPNTIAFVREKTKRTSRDNPRKYYAHILDKTSEIMQKWGKNSPFADDYIFNILNHDMSESDKDRAVKQFIKTTNKYLQRISDKLKLNIKLTTVLARHTYATVLMREGASIAFISENMHSNITTTSNHYLKGHEDGIREKWANHLID